jgi:hypothetical protein
MSSGGRPSPGGEPTRRSGRRARFMGASMTSVSESVSPAAAPLRLGDVREEPAVPSLLLPGAVVRPSGSSLPLRDGREGLADSPLSLRAAALGLRACRSRSGLRHWASRVRLSRSGPRDQASRARLYGRWMRERRRLARRCRLRAGRCRPSMPPTSRPMLDRDKAKRKEACAQGATTRRPPEIDRPSYDFSEIRPPRADFLL